MPYILLVIIAVILIMAKTGLTLPQLIFSFIGIIMLFIIFIFSLAFFTNNKNPLRKPINPKYDDNNIYDISIENTDKKKDKYHMKQDSLIKNPNEYKFGATLLYRAIIDQDIAQIKLLLESGADINKSNSTNIPYDDIKLKWFKDCNKTPLEASIINVENIEIVKLLVEYNADMNILLNLSIEKNNFEISELLLQKGANPNKISGYSHLKSFPLNFACRNQNLKLVKLLIYNGADVNFVGDDGRTALFEAISATKANKEIIRYLIASGADIHKEDKDGISPLDFAEFNKVSLVKVLTKHEELKLSENQDPNIVASYQNILDKIVSQNKVINKLKDELETIKKSGINNETAEEYKAQVNNFKETLLSQSNKIKELQNKLIKQEEVTNKNEKITQQSENIKLDELEKKFESKYDIQNKFIKSINSEIEHLKTETRDSVENNQIEELTLQAKVFQSTLTYQSDKIIELQNQLIMKEQKTKTLVDSFMSKINKLEEKIAKQKVVKTQIPLNIPTEKQSIKKDDGVIVKRDSFDDF